jgi:RNA polymerase sigma-70 factor (ECF subfamily)
VEKSKSGRSSSANAVDIAAVFGAHRARATAGLARRLGDLDDAEDAVADAFVLALERWPRDGMPADPARWIAVAARHRAIDRIRRERNAAEKYERLRQLDAVDASRPAPGETEDVLGDDRLELLFACIHPALDGDAQVALMLRTLGGLTTDEIADAFFIDRRAMQQRLVRAKHKIRQARIPFCVPPPERLAERLDAVAAVVYLIFTTGYAPPRGRLALRAELCETAIGLGELLATLLPGHSQTHALVALMRFHHARRATRADTDGHIVLLDDQDRSRWDAAEITRASAALRRALALPPCSFTYEAYIAAAHAHAPAFEDTDWDAIVRAYDGLLRLHDTPVTRCNRAVALAMRGDIEPARAAIDAIAATPSMARNRYYHVARGAIAARAGDPAAARAAYHHALTLAGERDRQVIARRIERLPSAFIS